MNLLLLAVFGALGTLARYGLQGAVQNRTGPGFPTGTLLVNLSGCFLMACMARYAFDHLWIPPQMRTSMLIGFFGAFTTYSSFSWEAVRMLEDGDWLRGAAYIGSMLICGFGATALGIYMGARL
jgi:CrcB protein